MNDKYLCLFLLKVSVDYIIYTTSIENVKCLQNWGGQLRITDFFKDTWLPQGPSLAMCL